MEENETHDSSLKDIQLGNDSGWIRIIIIRITIIKIADSYCVYTDDQTWDGYLTYAILFDAHNNFLS